VTIYRELAKERPALFRENLALSLEELSRRLEAAGRDDEHWRALMEAVSVRRRLARNRWGLPRISKVVLTILAQVLIMWLLRRNRRRSRNASGAAAGARHETASAADTVYSEQLTTRPPFDRFSNAAKQVLQSAETEAKSDGSNYIGTEHLLLALLKHTDSSASTLLMECSVQYSTVREMLTRVLDERESAEIKQLIPTSRVRRVLDLALGEASRMGCERVGTEHLLLGLVIEAEGIAAHVLHDYGITTNTLLTRSTLCIEDGTGYDQV
jgi:ATP-dependent Clp protease ATP-binding subunit ClpC